MKSGGEEVFSKGEDETTPFAETEITDEESQETEWNDDIGELPELEPEEEPVQKSFLPPRRKRKQESAQGELELDGGPKGKFEGESPNFHEGEDLDIPPFLRKKRR